MKVDILNALVFLVVWRGTIAISLETQFVKEDYMQDVRCSTSTSDIDAAKSVHHCGMLCSSMYSCKTFFYNSPLLTCSVSTVMHGSTSSCLAEPGTVYYRKNELVFGTVCTLNTDCWMANMVCLDSVCKCVLGYVYDQTTGKCVNTCAIYGTNYSKYIDTTVNVPYDNPTVTSPQDCLDACSASPICRGVSFWSAPPLCRVKEGTPLSHPGNIMTFGGVDYYIRNCA